MKTKKILTILCLLISASAYSQNLYPAKIEINCDTVVAITIPQMDTISARLIDCSRLPLADSLIAAKTAFASQTERLNDSLLQQMFAQGEQIFELEQKNEIQKTDNKLEKKKSRNRLLISGSIGLGGGFAVGAVVVWFINRRL